MRCSMVGTTTSVSQRCFSTRRIVFSGSNLRCITTVWPSASASANWETPVPWNAGGRHHHRLPASQRNPVEELGRRERRRVSAGSALRCTRGAAGEEDETALRGRRGQRTAVSALHHVVECADLGRRIVLRPGAIGDDLVREGLGDRVELVVVHERLNLLAGGDVDELGPGEPGVHQHQLGAVLGGGEHRQDQAAMIAAHASHDGTGSDAVGLPRPHQGVGLLLDVGVGERAALVDQGHRIQSGLGIRVDGPGERTVLPHGQDRSDAWSTRGGKGTRPARFITRTAPTVSVILVRKC